MPAENQQDHEASYAPVLTMTPAARAVVLEARDQEDDAQDMALWVEVNGVANRSYTYDIYFQGARDAGPSDLVQHDDELPVVIPAESLNALRGARLDLADDESGLVIVNPNTPPAAATEMPEGDLTSDLALRVLAVLDEQVNPGIAAHGGHAQLVAVEAPVAYLRLSGGCQGCGMAQVTLSQGIEVAITDAVPEITSIVDVTDHAGGTNPYFESAKK
jgi:Fe/S biogenesis protein NfuA